MLRKSFIGMAETPEGVPGQRRDGGKYCTPKDMPPTVVWWEWFGANLRTPNESLARKPPLPPLQFWSSVSGNTPRTSLLRGLEEHVKMPELPEVEYLKQTLEPILAGSTVLDVQLHRPDIAHHHDTANGRDDAPDTALLNGCRIKRLARHGKQLAIISETGRTICVHLGMSGQCLIHDPTAAALVNGKRSLTNALAMTHIHCRWRIKTPLGERELLFRDPRRFGGLWTFSSFKQLQAERWSVLGPDALTIRSDALRERMEQTTRPIKSALLDQRFIAGVGNIYADEALFRAGIHPRTEANRMDRERGTALARSIRATLRAAIKGGGSTLRDYRDAAGRSGRYQSRHMVYGRAGQSCRQCGTTLAIDCIGQRTTVFCAGCQCRGA